jgi:signal transduction histidine kinase
VDVYVDVYVDVFSLPNTLILLFFRSLGMQWTDRIRQVKILLVVMAILIAVASLVVSHFLVRDLAREESNNVEVWAEAMRSLSVADESTDLNLVLKVLNGNNTIPVIVLDKHGEVQEYRNIRLHEDTHEDSIRKLARLARQMKASGDVVRISLDGSPANETHDYMEICYDGSIMLKRLATYPYVQLGVVMIFVVVAIFALLSSKRAEQNKVWVGLSKETAHQLGTPISSLMAWVEILRESYPDDPMVGEMNKDVERLQLIAERFSKIGSLPEFKEENLTEVIGHVVEYMRRRVSKKVELVTAFPDEEIPIHLCAPLFEWVVENLCKNAVDAMEGTGKITLTIIKESKWVAVEVQDTGKGINKKHFNTVFTPGFTTKKRGWGLGLSLAKRIVEEYHKGKIFVKSSELNRGTTFRIELKV